MKRTVALAFLVSLISANVFADDKPPHPPLPPRTLSVSADAEVEALPDRTELNISIRSENINIQKAKTENDNTTKKFEAVAAELKLEKDNIKTQQIQISPQYDWTNNKQVLRNYQVNRNVEITIDDVSTYETLLSKLTDIGVTDVNGINFTLKNQDAEESKARAKAIEKAKREANEIATGLGVKVTKVLSVSESGGIQLPVFNSAARAEMMMDKAGGEAPPSPPSATPGKIKIRQALSVTFEIE